jgi:hypothetical protein
LITPKYTFFPLPELELLGGRYPQESNSKNNVCQGINVTKKRYNPGGDVGLARGTGLISPLIDNIIYKIYNKSNTDQELRMTQQVAVIMGDHEIDLVHAKQDNIKTGENTEIRGEISHLAEDQVFSHPDDTGRRKDSIGNFLTHPEKAPDPELPEDKDPFEKGVGIGDTGIADLPLMKVINKVIADGFSHQPRQGHEEKGLIGFAKTAETNQPRNTGYDRNYKPKIPMVNMHNLVQTAAVVAAISGTSCTVLKRLPVADLQGLDMSALFRFVA